MNHLSARLAGLAEHSDLFAGEHFDFGVVPLLAHGLLPVEGCPG
jgi:hypothetical protein